MDSDAFGRWGEEHAAQYLLTVGYQIVTRNWRCEYGEVDIVARDGQVWAFVEVKARRSDRFGLAEEAVTVTKQRRLVEVALSYLAEHELGEVDWRIDVVAISVPSGDTSRSSVKLYKNAVGEW